MPVAILGDVDAADRARVRTFAEEALASLDSDLGVPVRVVDRPADRDEAGWANRWGVNIAADQLAEDDDDLRWLVAEEVAHFWLTRVHGDGGDYEQELWATWFVSEFCDAEWQPGEIDQSSSYDLGRLVGGVLAGSSEAREAFDWLEPRLRLILLEDIDRLGGIDGPRELAQALADRRRSPQGA